LSSIFVSGLCLPPKKTSLPYDAPLWSFELERWIDEGRPVVLHGHAGRWLRPDDLVKRCDQIDVDNSDGVRQTVTRTSRQTEETMRLLAKQFAGVRESPEQVRVPVSLALGDSTWPVQQFSLWPFLNGGVGQEWPTYPGKTGILACLPRLAWPY
jgi:hypothetical protein